MDPLALSGAQTIHPNNEQNVVPQIIYSAEQTKHINFRRKRMIAARDVRDTQHDEFDGMTFLQWHDIQKKADDQFVAPRKNKTDTSINLGTIRDKDSSLLEYVAKYDFEPVAQVYDDTDDMLEEVAESAEDMVRKSFQLEDFKPKSKLIYRSMIAFGTALVEDAWVEQWIMEKTLKAGFKPGMGSDKAEWEEKLVKKYAGCQAKLWDLRKCYFGDFRKFFMNGPDGQPFFFTVEYEAYDVTKTKFGNWDRWINVPTSVVITPEVANATIYAQGWTLRPITNNYCEIIRYYDAFANEFAITINGVDMLPIMSKESTGNDGQPKTLVSGYPLIEVSPSGAIPFAKYDLEPMHECAYSKSQPAKMRVLADVENMLMKLDLGMIKQKAKPTMGNKSGKNFGQEVTEPSTVINDIRDGDLFPILPNFAGPAASDFSFFELVKKELDKNSVERSFQGSDNPSPQDETATKDMNDLKAQSLKVAAAFDGIIAGNNQLFWLRTYNIIKNWTKPIDQHVDVARKVLVDTYRTITVSSQVDGGKKATKKINFTKDTPVRPNGKATLEDSQAIHQQELDHNKETGKEIRVTNIHPELFAAIKLWWFYTCVPVPTGSDPLSYMMFSKQIKDAQAFFGPESLNVKRLKHRFSAMTGNDFDTWFLNEQELDQKKQEMMQAQQENAVPGQQTAGGPTIAGAASGANPAQAMGSIMK